MIGLGSDKNIWVRMGLFAKYCFQILKVQIETNIMVVRKIFMWICRGVCGRRNDLNGMMEVRCLQKPDVESKRRSLISRNIRPNHLQRGDEILSSEYWTSPPQVSKFWSSWLRVFGIEMLLSPFLMLMIQTGWHLRDTNRDNYELNLKRAQITTNEKSRKQGR